MSSPQEERYAYIIDFNQALKQLPDEVKVNYVDLSALFTVNNIRYADDGVHFKPDFYPQLLDYLKDTTSPERIIVFHNLMNLNHLGLDTKVAIACL
ncbi:hypothetical protein [Paenibacillus alvei]|uniref:SGNH hydrolase-type esterase domain-containing protein n=1 Tax=Paenibacillus alvei TaxID=44250 RepID=A0ABT4E8J6_PAEAL|nr:hypothetical protein [Paenibacillus alvei]MCY9530064.1 hypothetical protein [Paenibacillus alvei]